MLPDLYRAFTHSRGALFWPREIGNAVTVMHCNSTLLAVTSLPPCGIQRRLLRVVRTAEGRYTEPHAKTDLPRGHVAPS